MSREWEVGFVVPDGLRRAALIRLRLCALASLREFLDGLADNLFMNPIFCCQIVSLV